MSTIAETAETLSATPDTSTATFKDAYTINGCPVSFVYIEGFTHEYPSLMEEFHLPSVPVDPETDLPDFSNKDMLINSLNTIIKTPRLRTAFLEILSILQSDVYGAYRLDKAPILSLLEQYSRTLVPDGLLISGPHWDDEKGRMWRVFQKTDGGFTELAT